MIKIENKNTNSQTIKLGALGGLENQTLTLPSDGHLFGLYQQTPTKEASFIINKYKS